MLIVTDMGWFRSKSDSILKLNQINSGYLYMVNVSFGTLTFLNLKNS